MLRPTAEFQSFLKTQNSPVAGVLGSVERPGITGRNQTSITRGRRGLRAARRTDFAWASNAILRCPLALEKM